MPWVECQVTRAGPAENGVIYIALRANDNSFHNWFQANQSMEKEMLATALAALNMDAGVTAALTSTAPYSEIERLYVHR
jgi:hypothetical protein